MADFVVLEGIDGSGKTSVGKYIEREFDGVHITVEPTDSDVGKLVKRSVHEDSSPYYDLFLFLADRVEHTEGIKDTIERGYTVICDRYWGSTAAYQAASQEIELDYLIDIQQRFILRPDVTLLFEVDVDTALKRISGRERKSKYENNDYLKRVRDNYLELADRFGWTVIDAEKDLDEVKSRVYSILKDEI